MMEPDGYRETNGPGDDPAEAFERLRGEVSLLRHAIGALTTARENVDRLSENSVKDSRTVACPV